MRTVVDQLGGQVVTPWGGFGRGLIWVQPDAAAGPTAPGAPQNPAAVALSSSSIRITWDDVADETGYRVERSANGTTGWADVSGNLAAGTTQHDDTGLDPETEYFYRVFAFNAQGDSPASTTVSATTDAEGPGPGPGPGDDGDCPRIGGTGAIRRHPTPNG